MATSDPRRSGNPATRASAPATGSSSAPSSRFHLRSRALLVVMSRYPPLLVPGVMLILTLVGLSAPLPYAIPALVVAGAFVGWLVYLSWPVLSARGRFLRGLMLGLIIGAAIARATGVL